MHILHIYKDYYPVLGGIENHIKALSEGLVERGHRVTVLVTSPTAQDDIQHQGNLTIIKAARDLHMASTPLSWRMGWYARQLQDVDIIDLHFPYPPADLVALLVRQQPPLVITYHSDIVRQKWFLLAYRPLLAWTLRRAAVIMTTSPAYIASSRWLRPHASRCVVAPLSVDTERFATPDLAQIAKLRTQYGQPLVLFVGRLRYYKGLHFLLDALTQMRTDAHVLLVGNGPEEQRLTMQAQAAGLSKRVHFLGSVSDAELPAMYGAADVFVLPSHLRSEAFGIVQLEAQAASLPVVCTELHTGTSFITQHGKTGFVVPPAQPHRLARALDVVLANPALAKHMGACGRERVVQEFSHARMVERREAIYTWVVGEQRT